MRNKHCTLILFGSLSLSLICTTSFSQNQNRGISLSTGIGIITTATRYQSYTSENGREVQFDNTQSNAKDVFNLRLRYTQNLNQVTGFYVESGAGLVRNQQIIMPDSNFYFNSLSILILAGAQLKLYNNNHLQVCGDFGGGIRIADKKNSLIYNEKKQLIIKNSYILSSMKQPFFGGISLEYYTGKVDYTRNKNNNTPQISFITRKMMLCVFAGIELRKKKRNN